MDKTGPKLFVFFERILPNKVHVLVNIIVLSGARVDDIFDEEESSISTVDRKDA